MRLGVKHIPSRGHPSFSKSFFLQLHILVTSGISGGGGGSGCDDCVVAGLVFMLSDAAKSGVELALARAGADVESDGGVREAARADILRVTGGPGGGAGCC